MAMGSLPDRDAPLRASVIIPTHNRSGLLLKCLTALERQSLSSTSFEVLVAASDCNDDTVDVIHSYRGPLQLCLVELNGGGPSAARNLGAEKAQAPILVFIDDDIEPFPGFLEAHVRIHEQSTGEPRVVIGYLPPLVQESPGYFPAELRDWWEATFANLRAPGRRFRYSDLTSGNFSLPAALFQEVGGFDPSFQVHEDYELGLRLIQADAEFVYSDAAAGYHHEKTDLGRAFHRKFGEGQADLRLGQIYPELRPSFLMYRLDQYALLPSRLLRWFAFSLPVLGDIIHRFFLGVLFLLDRVGLYRWWQRILYGLLGYWYWRGVAQEIDSLRGLREFLSVTAEEQKAWSELDLALGLAQAECYLDACRPDGAVLTYKGQLVGVMSILPGGERLRGQHLRPFLAKRLPARLLRVLILSGDFDYSEVKLSLLERCEDEIQSEVAFAWD